MKIKFTDIKLNSIYGLPCAIHGKSNCILSPRLRLKYQHRCNLMLKKNYNLFLIYKKKLTMTNGPNDVNYFGQKSHLIRTRIKVLILRFILCLTLIHNRHCPVSILQINWC